MQRRLFFSALAAAVLPLAVFSCSSLAQAAQDAGDKGLLAPEVASAISRAAADITPEEEYYIGRAVGANILSRYQVYTGNPALTVYINKILQAIAINSPMPDIYNGYHAVILDSQEMNAFATSGGHIFVTLGLVNTARSEDALASVLAHEVAHIQLKHSIKAIRTSRITSALLITGSAAAEGAGLDLAELTDVFDESVSDIVSTLVNSGYSRDQEFEADTKALSLLAGAGYDPGSLLEMLQALDQALGNQQVGVGATHPAPKDRIANVNQQFASVPQPADTRAARVSRFTKARS